MDEPVKLHDVRPARVGVRRPVIIGPSEPEPPVVPDAPVPMPEPDAIGKVVWLESWRNYCEFRRSKCPTQSQRAPIWLDEMDQAIHELVGEIAELAQNVLQFGPMIVCSDDHQIIDQVEDEIGDVLFTGTWCFDCMDESFFGTKGAIEVGFLPLEARKGTASLMVALSRVPVSEVANMSKASPGAQQAVLEWYQEVQDVLLRMSISAGILSNRFKKLRWHRQDDQGYVHKQCESLFNIFVNLDALCVLTGASMLRAAHTNMKKLNERWPDGFKL